MADRAGRWGFVLLGVALVIGHVVVVRHAWPRGALPAAAVGGLLLLIAVKHLGIIAALFSRLRRKRR